MKENKRIPIDSPIESFETPWDDGVNAYTGSRIEEFLKAKISEALSQLEGKFGCVRYEGGRLTFYDNEDGTQLGFIDLNGGSYSISVESNRNSSFYTLTQEDTTLIEFSPTTKKVNIGSFEQEDFFESYTYEILVDSGSGFTSRTPLNNGIPEGGTGTVNIRPYLTTGTNRVRIIITGDTSGQVKTVNYSVILTSLTISCNHNWQKAWIGGAKYSINNIFFGGNMSKTLHVVVGGVDHTQTFSASTQYTSVPFSFELTDHFPEDGTGVYEVEVFMEGGGVTTESFKYRIMCVAQEDVNTAKLICFNNVVSPVVNYNTQTLFEYSTYNLDFVTANITANIDGTDTEVVSDLQLSSQPEKRNAYDMNVQVPIEIEEPEHLSISMTLSADGVEETVTVPFDNSKAYNATPGAVFYLNTANMSNNRPNRDKIPNTAYGNEGLYEANWDVFTFGDDGWYKDQDNNKALIVRAGSKLSVPDFKPLTQSSTSSITIEMLYQVTNTADYDKPVLSFMSTEEYDEDTSRGIMVFPSRIVVLSSDERAVVEQKIDLPESHIIHAAVVLQRNYANNGHNLCRIYINGRENCAFEYSGTSAFSDFTEYNYLRMGQESTDFALYMLRTYQNALEPVQIHNNFINALVETAATTKRGERDSNDILDSGFINYDMCKAAGYNCMVIESDYNLPSLDNPDTSSLRVNMRFEYGDTPEWNVNIYNVPIDGQGTTSMKYYMWNLRNKIGDDNTVWEYPNLKDDNNQVLRETGKAGYLAGYGLHPKVSKITSKKNVASSPQGHKMGATALYHDLFVACHGTQMLPNNKCRVAVYQNPFIGFQKFSDGHYEFIGLYTSGPDKTDKKTFGYNETIMFPKLMMIEGPNHAPYMTRFLVPWTDDVFYDYQNETLSTGDNVTKQEGWDADIAADYSTDKVVDQQNIFNLFVSEFKPLYDAVYYTSPYIASLSECGKTLNEINANITLFQTQKTNGYPNELMTFYDSQYRLVYFRYKTQRYEVLPLETHNMLGYLGLSGNPSTSQILEARHSKFLSTVFNYVDKEEALYMECFCQLFGVSDNYAKNTYWRKFKSLENGGKWGFNQDDLDTLFQNDNNGQDTKEYYIESDDKNNGAEIYQGSTSAFFYHLRLVCENDIRDKMVTMVNKMDEMAGRIGCSTSTLHGTVINVIGHYFWDKSSKYFPAMAYNEDSIKAYINVWARNTTASYNNVRPLTQLHGDHYETEYAWVERRIAYMFSKYRIGGFTGSSTDGYGTIEFTPLEAFDLSVKPAIDLYPRFSVGGAESGASTRTKAGDSCTLRLPGSSDTTVYLKGMDWIQDIGDLSRLRLASRGGSNEINFTVDSKRLRGLILGGSGTVSFNATNISINGPAIEYIDCRNAQEVRGILDLGNCPRLRTADFRNTKLTQILPPVGSKLSELHLPGTINTLFLHSLSLLREANLSVTDYSNIQNLYVENCSQLDALKILKQSLAGDSKLRFLTLKWDGEMEVSEISYIEALENIARNPYDPETGTGYGSLDYENGQLTTSTSVSDIRGTINVTIPLYSDTIEIISGSLPNVVINYDSSLLYIRFIDPVVGAEMGRLYGDGQGMTVGMIENVISIGNTFSNNADITSFDELRYFTEVTQIVASAFKGCSSLQSVTLPVSIMTIGNSAFQNCGSLTHINLPEGLTQIGGSAFSGCSSLTSVSIPGSLTSLGDHAFSGCSSLTSLSIPGGVTSLGNSVFSGCSHLTQVSIPDDIEAIGDNAFDGCSSLTGISIPGSVTEIGSNAFQGCTSMERVDTPDLSAWFNILFNNATSNPLSNGADLYANNSKVVNLEVPSGTTVVNSYIFSGCTSIESVTIPDGVTTIQAGAFDGCVNLGSINIPTSVTNIGANAFHDCGVITVRISDPIAWCGVNFAEGGNPLATSGSNLVIDGNPDTIELTGLTSIPAYAFKGIECNKMVLPDVTNIGANAFQEAEIDKLICKQTTPPTLGADAFADSTFPIYVPDSAVTAYRSASGWSGYAERIRPIADMYPHPAESGVIDTITYGKILPGSEILIPYALEGITEEAYTISASIVGSTLGSSIIAQNNLGFNFTSSEEEGEVIVRITLSDTNNTTVWSRDVTISIEDTSLNWFYIENLSDETCTVAVSSQYGGTNSSTSPIQLCYGTNKNNLSYSKKLTNTTTNISIDAHKKMYFKGDHTSVEFNQNYPIIKFSPNKNFAIGGAIMSIVDSTLTESMVGRPFYNMFKDLTLLVNTSQLILPDNTTERCYYEMFSGCTSLVNAPKLPATTLASNCYCRMFNKCKSLVNAPKLPATTLADSCYCRMFNSCIKLINAPKLPVTTLAYGCYKEMFYGCTSLVNAPELPATTLESNCYDSMFGSCTSLVNAPELPATTLASSCYISMFYECTSLVNAPELPATTLESNCYTAMFYGCTLLNNVKAAFITNDSSQNCTYNWLLNVASTGTFYKNVNATWNASGPHGVPERWTVVTYTP